jgi:hypothetical protein
MTSVAGLMMASQVHDSIADAFVAKLVAKINALKVWGTHARALERPRTVPLEQVQAIGNRHSPSHLRLSRRRPSPAFILPRGPWWQVGLPWEDGVSVTPLPEANKPKFLEGLIADAIENGATLANGEAGGGQLAGALMTPAVVDGVTPSMRLFHEEQFGPVVPVAVRHP